MEAIAWGVGSAVGGAVFVTLIAGKRTDAVLDMRGLDNDAKRRVNRSALYIAWIACAVGGLAVAALIAAGS